MKDEGYFNHNFRFCSIRINKGRYKLCFFTQHVFFHSTTSQEYPKLFVSSASMPLIAVMN